MPSFAIRGASGAVDPGPARWAPDQLSRMVQIGRRLYLDHLERFGLRPEPIGVVIASRDGSGRVVFEAPVLLPTEQFLELDLLRPRAHGRSRSRR
ncbi:MAG: hypothetical protein DBW85_04440 [Synechococcus sp. MED-G71]|nr:MAG: hypothetical protein DBW85_04440 [Synechococcus sp. MED-G71]